MIAITEKVYKEILELPTNERVELADKLLSDLTLTDSSVDQAWLRESERRLKEFKNGKIKAIPGEKVLRNIHKRLGI